MGEEPRGPKEVVEGLGVTFVLSVSSDMAVVVVVVAVLVVSDLHTPTTGRSAGGSPPERRFPSSQTESRNLASASSASITGKKSSDRLSNVLQ